MIRKLLRVFHFIWISLLLVFGAIFVLIQLSAVQSYLVNEFKSILDDKYGIPIEVEHIKVNLKGDVLLQNFSILDTYHQPILSGKELTVDVAILELLKGKYEFDGAQIDSTSVFLKRYPGDTLTNYTILLRRMQKKLYRPNAAPRRVVVELSDVELTNSVFYQMFEDTMVYSSKEIALEHLYYDPDSLHVSLTSGDVQWDSLFAAQDVQTEFYYLEGKTLIAQSSNILLGSSQLAFDAKVSTPDKSLNWSDDKTTYWLDLQPSILHKNALNIPALKQYLPERSELRGVFEGTAKRINGKGISVASEQSIAQMDVELKYIFRPEKFHFDATVSKARWGDKLGEYYLDSAFYNFNLNTVFPLDFAGRIQGGSRYAETQGMFKSVAGTVNADAQIVIDPDGSNGYYNADFDAQQLDLSTLFPNIGLAGIDGKIQARGEGFSYRDLDLSIDVDLAKCTFRNRVFEEVQAKGSLSFQRFEGLFHLEDSTMEIEFNGLANLGHGEERFLGTLDLVEVDLFRLGFSEEHHVLNSSLSAELEWSDLQRPVGILLARDVKYKNRLGSIALDSLFIQSVLLESGELELKSTSDIFDAKIKGDFTYPKLWAKIQSDYGYFLSETTLLPREELWKDSTDLQSYYGLVEISKPNDLMQVIDTSWQILDTLRLDWQKELYTPTMFQLSLGEMQREELFFKDIFLETSLLDSFGVLNLRLDTFKIGTDGFLAEDIDLLSEWNRGQSYNVLTYAAEFDSLDYSGSLQCDITLDSSFNLEGVVLPSSALYLSDSLWFLNRENSFRIESGKGLVMNNVKLFNRSQELTLSADFTRSDLAENLQMSLENVELAIANPYLAYTNTSLQGLVFGEIRLKTKGSVPRFDAQLLIDSLVVNEIPQGDLLVQTSEDSNQNDVQYQFALERKNGFRNIEGSAKYNALEGLSSLSIDAEIREYFLHFMEPYFQGYVKQFVGKVNGDFHYANSTWDASLVVDKLGLTVPLLGTRYNTEGKAIFKATPEKVAIEKGRINVFSIHENSTASLGSADISGHITHDNFNDIRYVVDLDFQEFLCLSTRYESNTIFYGDAVATGKMRLRGERLSPEMTIDASTKSGTDITMYYDDKEEFEENSFIVFVQDSTKLRDVKEQDIPVNTTFDLDMNLEIDPTSKVTIHIDDSELRGTGSGDLRLKLNDQFDFELYGNYVVEDADYVFAFTDNILQKKKFKIERGGNIKWTSGDPTEGTMDLKAVYTTQIDISALDTTERAKKTVNNTIGLSGELLQPDISFDIDIVGASELARSNLQQLTTTPEKKTRQFISVLLLNTFFVDNQGVNIESAATGQLVSSGARVVTSGINKWLNETQDQFELEVKFNPGTGSNLSNQEVEVILRKSFLNDRLHVNGNFGTPIGASVSRLKGDMNVEYDLREDRRWRLRLFNTSVEQQFFNQVQYRQGVGVFYGTDFDTLF